MNETKKLLIDRHGEIVYLTFGHLNCFGFIMNMTVMNMSNYRYGKF